MKESFLLCVHLDASKDIQKDLDQVLQRNGFQRIDTLLYGDASLDALDTIVRRWASDQGQLTWSVQRVTQNSVFEI